ncbi:MAG: alpha/beta hydrolase [Alphaproteobacteria bacterium]|nr:alpha/beta hydrolase [Alphaproteobacteria bacterium]
MIQKTRLPQEARADLVRAGPFPVPQGAEVGVTHTVDGAALRYACWRADATRREALVLILQGRTEFIERYGETIGLLLQRGFDVLAFDWRGQGGSQRLLPHSQKGHVASFDDYGQDLEAILSVADQHGFSKPRYVLAHSMGGAILLNELSKGYLKIERGILSAPMIGLSMIRAPRVAHLFANIFFALGLSAAYVPGGNDNPLMDFENNPLTPDPLRFGISRTILSEAPDLAIASPTIGWVKTSFDAMVRLQDSETAQKISTSLLFIAGPQDRITDTKATERFVSYLRNGRLIELEGAEHEILLERDALRKQFWQALDEFIG